MSFEKIVALTWNVGTNGDYIAMEGAFEKHLEKSADGKGWIVLDGAPVFNSGVDLENHRKLVEPFRIQRIKNVVESFAKEVPVFCFQELERDWKIEQILPDDFEFFKHGDEVIAWDKKRFSFESGDFQTIISQDVKELQKKWDPLFALALLKSKQTGEKILVCSAHLTGCDPDQPEKDEAMWGNNQVAIIGDLIKEISEKAQVPFAIIGVDANVTRHYPDRLKNLTLNDFVVDDALFSTNVNLRKYAKLKQKEKEIKASESDESVKTKVRFENTESPLQKIDYIAVLGGTISPPGDCFFDNPNKSVPLQNLTINPSDHKPFVQEISYQVEEGFFTKVFKSLFGK